MTYKKVMAKRHKFSIKIFLNIHKTPKKSSHLKYQSFVRSRDDLTIMNKFISHPQIIHFSYSRKFSFS